MKNIQFFLRLVLLTTSLISSSQVLSARLLPDSIVNRKESFLNRVYFPTEIGFAIAADGNLNPGIFMRTSLEYRNHALGGWYYAVEYDYHCHTYEQKEMKGSNATQGDATQYDILGGVGYRIPLPKHWGIAGLIQGGTSINHLKNVIALDGESYQLDDIRTSVPAAKATLMLEYYLEPAIGFFLNCGYTAHLKKLPTDLTKQGGILSVSAGVTWSLQ